MTTTSLIKADTFDPAEFFPAFFSARSEAKDIDELIEALSIKFPDMPEDQIAPLCVGLEKSILMDFQPTSSLDFHHELQKQYYRLQELTKAAERYSKILVNDDNEPNFSGLKAMLDVLKVGKDYLKLILDAQKEFYNAKEMQEFMETVLDAISTVDPKIKQAILEALVVKKMKHG